MDNLADLPSALYADEQRIRDSVLVPMAVVRGVTMLVVEVIVVIEVAHRFVAASGPVNVGMICVDEMSFEEALVPVVPVGMMDVALVQVVSMVAVRHGHVAAALVVDVLVHGMNVGQAVRLQRGQHQLWRRSR